jgi:hypothetical protein
MTSVDMRYVPLFAPPLGGGTDYHPYFVPTDPNVTDQLTVPDVPLLLIDGVYVAATDANLDPYNPADPVFGGNGEFTLTSLNGTVWKLRGRKRGQEPFLSLKKTETTVPDPFSSSGQRLACWIWRSPSLRSRLPILQVRLEVATWAAES